MLSRRRALPWLVFGLLACCIAGCIDEKAVGNATVYAYAPWVGILATAGGLLAVPAGLLLRRQSTRFAWVLLIAGPILLVVIAPGTWLDRLEVDNDHFALRTGLWFAPTKHDVRFDDLSRIAITAETRRTRRGGKRTHYYLDCYSKAGAMQHVPVGTLMKEGDERILANARARGVPVADETGGL